MKTGPNIKRLPAALLLLLVASCSRKNTTSYYYPVDLQSRNLPVWQVTNAIPLTPDQAVLAATRYLSSNYPTIASWEVDSIDLRKDFDTTWIYSISLTDRQSGHFEFEVVRVLMDGGIWVPSKEKRER